MKQISRRSFIQGSSLLAAGMRYGFAKTPAGTKHLLLMGTQTSGSSKGIYASTFDSATGQLSPLTLAAETENPTFLALSPNGRTVVAANEVDEFQGRKTGAVTSFTLNKRSGQLQKVSQVAAAGQGTCHVSFDRTGRCVFAADYAGGSAASFTISPAGQLGSAVSSFQYTGHGPTERQAVPHAHRVTVSPDNRFLLVNDLGLDEIHIYRLDASSAKLSPNDPPAWKSAAGAGPRALQFHPNGTWVYCVNELNSTVSLLRWNAATGALDQAQTISLLPEGYDGPSGPSEVVLDKAGRFVYVANRKNDFIATFAVADEGGRLTLLKRTSCGGTIPRHIALDPSNRWLLIANQGTDNIAVFARDRHTGLLADSGQSFPLSKPQCLVFA